MTAEHETTERDGLPERVWLEHLSLVETLWLAVDKEPVLPATIYVPEARALAAEEALRVENVLGHARQQHINALERTTDDLRAQLRAAEEGKRRAEEALAQARIEAVQDGAALQMAYEDADAQRTRAEAAEAQVAPLRAVRDAAEAFVAAEREVIRRRSTLVSSPSAWTEWVEEAELEGQRRIADLAAALATPPAPSPSGEEGSGGLRRALDEALAALDAISDGADDAEGIATSYALSARALATPEPDAHDR